MWLVAPDVADKPTWMLQRDPTAQEEQDAAKLALIHYAYLRDMMHNPPPPKPTTA